MKYKTLMKRVEGCLSEQVSMYIESICWCGGDKPKLYIPKGYKGLFVSCDDCHTDLKLLKRELTPQEYFTVRITCQ